MLEAPVVCRFPNLMRFNKLTFILLFAPILASTVGRAQNLVHAYYFEGTLADSVGSVPLVSAGGSLATTQGSYSFTGGNTRVTGQGLEFVGASSLQSTYTIAMRFSFNNLTNFRRLIEFKNLSSDNGAYTNGNTFVFYNSSSAVGGSITAGATVDFTLSRASDKTVTAYLGSTQIYSFSDTQNMGVADSIAGQSTFWFFNDDNEENPTGRVDALVIYDGVVSAEAIAAGTITNDLSAIPEPSTYAAIFGGVALIGTAVYRRRRSA